MHPLTRLIGKPVDCEKMPDGRTIVEAYRDALAASKDNKGFIELKTLKPGTNNDKRYPKLNFVLKFEP